MGFAVLVPIEVCVNLVSDLSVGMSLPLAGLAMTTLALTLLNLFVGEWIGERFKKLRIYDLVAKLVMSSAIKRVNRQLET